MCVFSHQYPQMLYNKLFLVHDLLFQMCIRDRSTAVLIPFHTQEIMQPGGIYYGQNAVSKNMLVADRRKLLNGNSFRLGVSGSGKSFSAKEEIVDLALSTEDDILILDPESEFGSLVEEMCIRDRFNLYR